MDVKLGICGLTSDHVWDMGDGFAGIDGVQIAAVADPHAELCERAAARWRGARTFATAEALLDGAGVEAVLACGDKRGQGRHRRSRGRPRRARDDG